MKYDLFVKKLKEAGFAESEAQADKQIRILVNQFDKIRLAKDRIEIPGFAVLKTKATPAKANVMIGGRMKNVRARLRFVFKPATAQTLPPPF